MEWKVEVSEYPSMYYIRGALMVYFCYQDSRVFLLHKLGYCSCDGMGKGVHLGFASTRNRPTTHTCSSLHALLMSALSDDEAARLSALKVCRAGNMCIVLRGWLHLATATARCL